MPQSLAKVLMHIIFATKHRSPFLRPHAIRGEAEAYMSTVLKGVNSPAIAVKCVEDHVHVLCSLSRTHTIAKVIEEVKKSSSKWLKTKGHAYQHFQWQNGYGAFSVSASKIDEVRRYILDQEEHHRRRTFQEEYRQFLRRHGVPYDERYVWD